MASRTDRAFEDAFALGCQNQLTVELARCHPLNTGFPELAGRAWRSSSGLPSMAATEVTIAQDTHRQLVYRRSVHACNTRNLPILPI